MATQSFLRSLKASGIPPYSSEITCLRTIGEQSAPQCKPPIRSESVWRLASPLHRWRCLLKRLCLTVQKQPKSAARVAEVVLLFSQLKDEKRMLNGP